jgi:hypothetical protein
MPGMQWITPLPSPLQQCSRSLGEFFIFLTQIYLRNRLRIRSDLGTYSSSGKSRSSQAGSTKTSEIRKIFFLAVDCSFYWFPTHIEHTVNNLNSVLLRRRHVVGNRSLQFQNAGFLRLWYLRLDPNSIWSILYGSGSGFRKAKITPKKR